MTQFLHQVLIPIKNQFDHQVMFWLKFLVNFYVTHTMIVIATAMMIALLFRLEPGMMMEKITMQYITKY